MIDIKAPELAESISEASLLEWKKGPGDAVAEGVVLVEVETDKIALEVYAPQNGVLTEILKPNGAQITSGELIARMDETAKIPLPPSQPTSPTPSASSAPPTSPASSAQSAPSPSASAQTSPAASPAPVMPAARKIAAEQGVNPAEISGTGKGGRVTKGDVLSAVQSGKAGAGMASGSERAERRVPMTKLRARIAERLLESQRETASLTTFNEADMSAVMRLRAAHRDAFQEKHGVKLGFMSFFARAAASALRQFPIVNASVDGGDIVYHDYCDIGVAVGTPRGLVVPILRDVESMSFAEIESAIADFGARAQTGSLSLDEISGGTFTVTNGGVFGSMLSTPIINPPQSAILGIHATKERPMAEGGQVVVRPMNYLALSYDHRIIDGREAVLFLAAVKNALEDPARMLLDL